MCLVSAVEIHHEEEIKCYKFLIHDPKNSVLSSPYFSTTCWEFGKTKTAQPFNKKEKPFIDSVDEHGQIIRYVHGLAFHTYKNLEDAKKAAKAFSDYYDVGCGAFKDYVIVVVECTIPRNSTFVYEGYAEGIGKTNHEGYASEKLTVDKFVYVVCPSSKPKIF